MDDKLSISIALGEMLVFRFFWRFMR